MRTRGKILATTAALGMTFGATSCGETEGTLPFPMADTEAACWEEAGRAGSNVLIDPGQKSNNALKEMARFVDQQMQIARCQKAVLLGNAMLEAYNSQGEDGKIVKLSHGSDTFTLSAGHVSGKQIDTVSATYLLKDGAVSFDSLEAVDAQEGYSDTAMLNRANIGSAGLGEDGIAWVMDVVRDEGDKKSYAYYSTLFSVESVDELNVYVGRTDETLQNVRALVNGIIAHPDRI